MPQIEFHKRRPQDDVPVERIIHYVVKDYRRMFIAYDEQVRRAEKAEQQVYDLKEKNSKLRSQLESNRRGFEKNLQEVRDSRDAALRERTETMEGRLNEALRQNKLLAQAVLDPQQASVLLAKISEPTYLDASDDRLFLAMKQLDVALLKMNTIEMRLSGVEGVYRENYRGEQLDSVLKRFKNAFAKIDSVTMRIEDFFNKLGDVRIRKEDGK